MQTAAPEPVPPLAVPLTEREREILCLVAQGWTNQQIAGELVVAHRTVRWYLRQIYSKLGVNGRAEAVTRAQALGLVAGPAACPLLVRSLSLFEQVDHAVGAAKAAQRLAAATLLMGDPARAIGPAREALRRHQKLGNESWATRAAC